MSRSPLALPQLFTAARLAALLGLAKRSVLERLKTTESAGTVLAGGNPAQGWHFADLPTDWRETLVGLAKRQGYRDVFALNAAPPALWQPEVPLVRLADRTIDRARRLQRALLPMLARMEDGLPAGEFNALGVRCYQDAFGYAVSPEHFAALLQRTVERDGGREDWERLEIYLDTKTAKREAAKPSAQEPVGAGEIAEVLAMFKDRSKPTREETALLYARAFEVWETLQTGGRNAGQTKAALLKTLHHLAPFLAASVESLRKLFTRNHARWLAGERRPEAILDQRAKNSGRFRELEIPQADLDTVTGHAVLCCGGRVSQAWRELLERNELSPEVLERYQGKSADKSHVPKSIRRLVSREVAMMDDIHHGPRQARLNGAHIDRDWSKVHAGDWMQADDVTFPVYYYEPDGKGWFTLWRGQCLVMIDLRTLCVLSFVLISSRNYNSKAIRTLITRTADEHGLPRRGFYFEQGIWKSSRLLIGKNEDPLAVSAAETEKGLKDIGLEFRHSLSPRGKPIERVLGLHQNQMERAPGYVGRNEMTERFERIQKHKLAVEAKKLHPSGHFLSVDEWTERLTQIFARYNAEIQQGKMLSGLSPEQAFVQLQDPSNPPVRFDARCRFLLSHHRRPIRVTRNGIRIQIGKESFVYRNAETGRHIGEEMLAWWNPETPEVLCVTDLNRENVFAVERAESVPAIDATEEQIGSAMAQINAHGSYARERYRVLKTKLAPRFRANAVTQDVSELGRQIREKSERVRMEKAEERRRSRVFRSIDPSAVEALLDDEPSAPSRCGLPETDEETGIEQLLDDPQPTSAKAPANVDHLKSLLQSSGDDEEDAL